MVVANLVTHPVHLVGDVVMSMVRKVFVEGCRVYLAPERCFCNASRSARSKMSSGIDTAVFIPAI